MEPLLLGRWRTAVSRGCSSVGRSAPRPRTRVWSASSATACKKAPTVSGSSEFQSTMKPSRLRALACNSRAAIERISSDSGTVSSMFGLGVTEPCDYSPPHQTSKGSSGGGSRRRYLAAFARTRLKSGDFPARPRWEAQAIPSIPTACSRLQASRCWRLVTGGPGRLPAVPLRRLAANALSLLRC